MKEVQDREAFFAEAAHFIRALPAGRAATVVALSGELGAGKTTFVQAVARELGVEEVVASPTFVVEKVYGLAGERWQRLVHIDAYRLKDEHELEVLGWKDVVADPQTLVLLEWPERVEGLLPEGVVWLRFDIAGEGRIITGDGF